MPRESGEKWSVNGVWARYDAPMTAVTSHVAHPPVELEGEAQRELEGWIPAAMAAFQRVPGCEACAIPGWGRLCRQGTRERFGALSMPAFISNNPTMSTSTALAGGMPCT